MSEIRRKEPKTKKNHFEIPKTKATDKKINYSRDFSKSLSKLKFLFKDSLCSMFVAFNHSCNKIAVFVFYFKIQ